VEIGSGSKTAMKEVVTSGRSAVLAGRVCILDIQMVRGE